MSTASPQASRRGACYAPARFRTGVPLAAIGPTGGAVREALGKSASAGAGCSQELVGSLEGVNGVGIEKVSSPFIQPSSSTRNDRRRIMSFGLNRAEVIGRLGADVTIKVESPPFEPPGSGRG